MAGAFDAKVEISTREAKDGLRALRKETAELGAGLRVLDGILKQNKGNIAFVAHQFTKLVAEQRKAAAATKESAQAEIAAARASGIRNTSLAKEGELLARKANQEAQAARATAMGAVATARVTDIEQRRAMAVDKAAASTRRAAASQLELHDSMSNSRYLMYDVGATYAVISAGLLAIPVATAAVSAAYQKDFANVIRVNETLMKSDEASQAMKESLKGLATEIPVAFGELSRIAQLGSQMGVANDKLAAFTETTAKFVAVTGIAADPAATLFGRMETSFSADVQQFPDFFERVGSAIEYVGSTTVATDPEIASMLNQIGPLGASAGMAAHEVIGLAGALASVRVQPELARGTLTRVFGQLNRDAAEGSPRMAEFGKLMGITGDAASKLWKTDSSKFFNDLMAGLQGVQQEQGQLTTTLDKLGIKASRDVSALTKLAVGFDVLELSMANADKGFTDGTFLSEATKPIFETLIAQLEMMANAWKNLGETLGSGGLAPLAVFVDTAKNLALGLDSLIDKVPLIGHLMSALMGIASVTALFLGFKSAQAFVMAGMIGFQQASARGMAGGLGLSSMARTLAQTMLMAKGATDQQSRALLGQVSALRMLTIASATSSTQIAKGATVAATSATGMGRFTGSIKGASGALLGLVGGPIGIALGGLALLAGGFLNTAIEAESAGKAIAEAMQQGAAAGTNAAATKLTERKVGFMDAIAVGNLGKNLRELAEEVDLPFEKLAAAAIKGKDAVAEITPELDRIAQSKGYKDFADLDNMNGEGAGKLRFIVKELKSVGDQSVSAAKDMEAIEKAAPLAGKGMSDMGDGAEDATDPVDDLTKALKALNDEVFGTINAEADLQAALASIGEGLHESKSYSVMDEGGRANIQNFQDAMTKARDYYTQLMAEGTLSAEQSATGYAEFVEGLINEIRVLGGDTSGVEALAANTKAKFTAAIGGAPVSVPVTYDTVSVQTAALDTVNLVQNWINAHPEPAFAIGADGTNAANAVDKLVQGIMAITGLPFDVVMDAMTDPAHEKAREVEALLIAITTDTYVAPVDVDTSAAITNIQNFVAFARTELARVQAAANGGIGYGDGEGSMSPSQKAAYGKINTSAPVLTKVKRAPVSVPSASIPPSVRAGLGGIADGYKKAGTEAAKAGKAGKKAGKDIADGIDDAVKSAEDFGNRLKTALMSAYNQHHGLNKATDEYHSALNAINKKREDEIKQVSDLRDRVRELNNERDKELISASKAKIEQGISVKYGETDRAADYGQQAKQSLDNASAKQKEIDVANKEATTIQNGIGLLTGYSDAAIANREALRNLELKTIDMIAAYAAQGATTEQVRRYAQGLTAQFQTDVGQIGFNQAAVQGLTGDMSRYIDVVNSVPQHKPTEVTADVGTADSGAMGAINDFGEALAANTQDQVVNVAVALDTSYATSQLRSLEAQIKGGGTPDDPSMTALRPGSLAPAYNLGGSVMGMYGGGMVPGTPPANPRMDNMLAKVDGKGLIKIRSREFIQPQESVDYYGPDFMEAIRTMSLPKFNMGGSPSGARGGAGAVMDSVVELGASTLAALAEMRQEIKLFADSRELASSVNTGNKQLAAEGHR